MKKCLITKLILLISVMVNSQTVMPKPDISPGSPDVAAFAKNINIPMSYSSGTPQISIPFGSVKSGGLELPVSISYNASGIRVEEVPTWVGLGWNMNAGGQISRTMRMLPDESYFGYISSPNNRKVRYVDSIFCWCLNYSSEEYQISAVEIPGNQVDLEPDQFTFSFMGYSGDFMWNQDSGKFILFPYQNILLEYILSSSSLTFTLTLPNGVKGVFGNSSSSTEKLQSGTTTSYVDGVSYDSEDISLAPYANAWMLAKIIEPTGKEIVLEYQSESITIFGRGGESFGPSMFYGNGTTSSSRQSFFENIISKPVLTSITGESGKIRFKQSNLARLDMPGYPNASKSLDTIQILTPTGLEVKRYHLKYGYFISANYDVSTILDVDKYDSIAEKRLYLQSITEKSGGDSLPPYIFQYNDISLPSRFSTAQDNWGYYNGKTTNGRNLIPRIPSFAFSPFAPDQYENSSVLPAYGAYLNSTSLSFGSDRRIDTNYSQAGILKKIRYPTGGTTEYFYEQNTSSIDYLQIYGGLEPPDLIDKSFVFSDLSSPIPNQAPYPLYFKGIFEVILPATKVKITTSFATCQSYMGDPSCIQRFVLRKRSDSSIIFQTYDVKVDPVHYQLAKGEYIMEVITNGSSDDYPPSFEITASWGERPDSINFLVGGVRVRKIVSSDSLGNSISRSFSYNYDAVNKSSGILNGYPTYKLREPSAQYPNGARENYTSSSVLTLTPGGKTIRYNYVSEFLDTLRSEFKTTYEFSNGIYQPKQYGAAHFGTPPDTRYWQDDLLKRKKVFEKTTSGLYRVIMEEEHSYYMHQPVSGELYGLYGRFSIPYSFSTEWWLPDSSSTKTYTYQNTTPVILSSGVKYLYNNKYLQSETRSISSKGDQITNKSWYPTDFNAVTGFNIPALKQAHIWLPVRQESLINGKVKAGSVIKYSPVGRPMEGYAYESQTLTNAPAFDPDVILTSNYKLKTSIYYDQDGNPLQVNDNASPPAVYIWSYELDDQLRINNRPMAVVHNADSTSVAYTSFETEAQGGWNYFIGNSSTSTSVLTGIKSYSLSNVSISKSGLSSSGVYVVSYWGSVQQTVSGSVASVSGKTANGLTYYEHRIESPEAGTVTLVGSGIIDELRLYPVNAQMITYDYTPLGQLRTMCDVSNKVVRYQYDSLRRLSLVRDIDSNILKKYCYNYAGQVENCGLGTDAQWQIVSNACEVDSLNRNTGNLIKVKKDTNPNSATYGQTSTSIISNPGQCPLPYICTTSNCAGNDKKCVNNICETGIKEYTGSTRLNSSTWRCWYVYRFSDNSTSSTYYEDRNVFTDPPCPI